MYRTTKWIVCVLTLTACTAVPKVEYTKITAPSDLQGDEIDSFSFWESQIIIDKGDPVKDTSGNIIDNFTIISKPREFAAYKIGIRRADSWGVKTNFNLTKIPNTSLGQEIGIDITNSRAELITKYGGIISKIIGLVALNTGDLEDNSLPKTINLQAIFRNAKVDREAKKGLDAADGVTLNLGAIPVDAVEASSYKFPVTLSGIMYSACRDVTVQFNYKGRTFEKTLTIADPRYFSFVGFPVNGKVTFHSECGVSTTSSKDTTTTEGATIVDALVVQSKAIKDALDAANKSK